MNAESTFELACLDGVVSPAGQALIPATDDGLLRGDGAFEVIRVYAGRPFALDEHLDRLERSAKSLLLPLPGGRPTLEAEIRNLITAREHSFDGCVRIVVTRGGHRLILTEPLPPERDRITLCFVTYAPPRLLDGVKSLSYAANMLAGRLARERGFDEALLTTPHGRVLEAPTASIFWVSASDGELCTPGLDDHILASITRDRVIALTGARERALTKEELLDASEAFLASTTREVQPVAAVEQRDFGPPGERSRSAAALVGDHIRASLE
ncbi:MAG: aminodeoxychorismate lyase [Thermoleophilaceae bacterium]